MQLKNLSPYSALSYCIEAPEGDELWAVVARGAYDLHPEPGAGDARSTHALMLAGGELSVKDEYYGTLNQSSVRYESDLAQMKPRCDVIVLGSAHSPTGEPVARMNVRVRIERPRDVHDFARAGLLLDHHLAVCGARWFERRGSAWQLTPPEPFKDLPLRYEHAFGGELKVYADDPAADRVASSERLSDEMRARHPEGANAPIAHTTCVRNPLGMGFLERWYVDAVGVSRWPAPHIERPGAGITAELFAKMLDGELRAGELPALSPHGTGVIAKPWSPRLELAGTLDAQWLDTRWPRMPDDFKMAYWNGAHPDMQCPHLFGGELCELVNVLPPETPGAVRTEAGTVCRFVVPDAGVVVGFAAPDSTEASVRVAAIDTLIIDLEAMTVCPVWRVVVPATEGFDRASLLALGHPLPEV